LKNKKENLSGLTSSHHMAAEAAVGRWKAFVKKTEKDKFQLVDGPQIRERALRMDGAQTDVILYRPSINSGK